jgi:hypothetical protein
MAGVRPAGERLVLLSFVDSAAFCLDHQEHTLLGHQTDTGKFPLVQGKALNSANFTAVTGYAVSNVTRRNLAACDAHGLGDPVTGMKGRSPQLLERLLINPCYYGDTFCSRYLWNPNRVQPVHQSRSLSKIRRKPATFDSSITRPQMPLLEDSTVRCGSGLFSKRATRRHPF